NVLAAGGSYPDLTIIVSVATDIAPSVVNVATVSGGGDVNSANNSASDTTSSIPVADLTISKSHVGDFRQGNPAEVYTLTVTNVGPAPTDGGVTVIDTLPTGLTPSSDNNATINGWSVSFVDQT